MKMLLIKASNDGKMINKKRDEPVILNISELYEFLNAFITRFLLFSLIILLMDNNNNKSNIT